MYTECPHCHAIFRVTQAILQAAGGKVRCGECSTVFQAVKPRKQKIADPKQDDSVLPSKPVIQTEPPKQKPKPEKPVDRRGTLQDRPVASTSSFHRDADETTPHAESTTHVDEHLTEEATSQNFLPKYLPVPIAPHRPRLKRRRSALFTPLLIALIFLLFAQSLITNRKYLGTKPLFRPVVTALCQVTGCKVPQHRDIDGIELLNHGVYSHPTVPGALMIKAVIENRASFEQPYPVIELGFSNIQSKQVAMRRFGPSEYLDLRNEHSKFMPVGKSIPIRLEVIDPGKTALAFEFNFL